MKKLLSIILAILMIVTGMPMALAAGDGTPLTIDVTQKNYVYIGSGETYYDEDGYILTGSSESVRVDVKESCNLTLQGATLNKLVTQYAPEESVINITLDGANEVTGYVAMMSEHLVFDGDETASFKAPYLSTSGNPGTVTVNGGNIIIDRVVDTNSSTIDCADFIINAGTVTFSNNYHYVVGGPVKLNGGTLNLISTAPEKEVIDSYITMDKGALLTVSSESGKIFYVNNTGILKADSLTDNDCFFVRYDTTSDFVLVTDINAALEGKTYAEIKIDSHSHSFVDGVCDVCGYICLHKNTTDGTCDDCGQSGRFVVVTMNDSYGDGWNGNTIIIRQLVDGEYKETATATFDNGKKDISSIVLSTDGVYSFEWIKGSYSDECSFTVAVDGETVYEATDGSQLANGQVLYTLCAHPGQTGATCVAKGVCEICGEEYGDIDADAHDWSNNDGICANGCGYECPHENQTGETCEICGAELHTCDFTGEWKYDADKHWKECAVEACNEVSEEAVHTYENGKCDCGYECPHESYTKGKCDVCEYPCFHSFTDFTETVAPKCEESGWEESYCDYGCGIKLEQEIPALEHDWVSGGVERPTQNIDGSWSDGYYYDTCKNDATHINITGVAKRGDYEKLNELLAKAKAYYADETLTDEAKAEIAKIINLPIFGYMPQNLIETELNVYIGHLDNVVTKTEAGIEDGTLVKVDGNAILVEYNNELAERLIEKYGEEKYREANDSSSEEIKAEAMAIEKEFMALTGTVAENAEKIAKLKARFKALFDAIELCLAGTHSYEYEVTTPAKCGENAIETGICSVCGATDEREVEGTALEHSFTTYSEVTAPECGKAGLEKATCDNGCGATDEKEIPALEHIFLEYTSNGDATCTADGTKTAECSNGCGATDTVTDEDSMLDHADEDGDKICDDCQAEIVDTCPDCGRPVHEETGIPQYVCILIMLIRLVVSFIIAVK